MKSISRVTMVFAAVFALSALAASSALAAPEWLSKTGGTFKKITSPLEVSATANITVNDTGAFGLGATCQGTMEGSLETSGVAKIKNFSLGTCKGLGRCTELFGLTSLNLPWKTELYKEGTKVREKLVNGGSGVPGWKMQCRGIEGTEEDTCYLDTSAKVFNNGLGGAEAEFDSTSAATGCTVGGITGKVEGVIAFLAPKSVEAIEAEGAGSRGEWLQGGVSLTKTVATKSKGEIAIADKGTGVTSECEAAGEGTAELNGGGKDTKWVLTKCVVTHGSGTCLSAVAEPVNLPWHTELVGEHDIITSGGSGEPGFKRTCETILGKAVDIITGKSLQTAMENATGGVNATFVFPGEWLKCTLGREGSVEGTQLVEATTGGKLGVA